MTDKIKFSKVFCPDKWDVPKPAWEFKTHEDAFKCEKFVNGLLKDNAVMRDALIKLRDCNWVITLPDRMDGVREIAGEALKEIGNE